MDSTAPFLVMFVMLIAMGAVGISASLGMLYKEQQRHNKVMEQILAEIRDRLA